MIVLPAALRAGTWLSLTCAVLVACTTSSNNPAPVATGPDAAVDAAVKDVPEGGHEDGGVGVDAPSDADVATDALDAAVTRDVFVDPSTGLDSNVGTVSAPFKTIHKALTAVPAGSTVWLADGAYIVANEGGAALSLPDGARVSATNVGGAIFEGLAVTAGAASGALLGVVLDKGSSLTASNAASAAPTLTLANVEFRSRATGAATLSVGGNTKATLTQSSFTGPLPSFGLVQVAGAAELALVGGTFDGAGGGVEGFGYSLISVVGTSKLSLDGVTMKNFQAAAIAVGGSSPTTPAVVVLKNGTLLDTIGTADNCASGASVIVGQNADVTLDASEIKNAKTAGICVRGGASSHVHVTLQNGAKLTNDVNGVRSEPGTGAEMTLVVNGATFTGNVSAGVYFEGGGSFDLTSATMTGNGSGINTYPGVPLSIKARSSTFANNTSFGVAVTTVSTLALDLGTAASPGLNTLSGNTTTGIYLVAPAAQSHTAMGNTWNASVEGADATGKYTAGTSVVGPKGGTNYQLLNASTLTL